MLSLMEEPRCTECGGPNRVERVRKGKRFCAECGVSHAVENARRMRREAVARYERGLPVARPWRYRVPDSTS